MINQWIWGDPIFNETHISEMIWTWTIIETAVVKQVCSSCLALGTSDPWHLGDVAHHGNLLVLTPVYLGYIGLRNSGKSGTWFTVDFLGLSQTFSLFPRFRLDHSIVSAHLRFVKFVNFWDTCGSGPVGVLFRNVAKRDDKNCSVEHGDTTCNEHGDLKGYESGGSI